MSEPARARLLWAILSLVLPVAFGLLAFEVLQLGMAIETGAGRDKAHPQQARECTRWNKLMFEVAFKANKSLGTMNFAEVQG